MIKRTVEQAVLLGMRKSLVAIVTNPVVEVEQGLPLVLILNSGIIHRVGSNRLSVSLARALAELGFCCARFDLSGIGDSEPREHALPPFEAGLADIREAIDSLAPMRNVQRVILMGLCSGADHALFYAGSDPRVVGIVLLDPSVPRTPRYYISYYRRRLLRGASWLNILRGTHPIWRLLSMRAGKRAPASESSEQSQQPAIDSPQVRQAIENAYLSTLQQDRQILAVFTAGRETRHNYRNQLLDAFPVVQFKQQLRLEYFAACDHAFTSECNRAKLIALVTQWFNETAFTP